MWTRKGIAIVSTFKRLPYLLWGGVAIHCDHQNLAYIFDANGAPTSKVVAQRLQGWHGFLGQLPYTIVHILATRPAWGTCCHVGLHVQEVGVQCTRASSTAEVLFAGSDKFRTKVVVPGVQAAAAGDAPSIWLCGWLR